MHMLSRTFPLLLCVLAAFSAAAAPQRPTGPIKAEGEIGTAQFRIDIPENWNGGLIVYAHGYVTAAQAAQFNEAMIEVAFSQGYAIAQSLYSHQGWAAREGILDTEALRRFFEDRYGETYPTIIAGHSQGAAITYSMIERYPEVYDGALPMCGAGSSALDFMKERVFDMRLLFDYFFPGLPGSAVEFPEGMATYGTVQKKAGELVKQDPERARAFARMVNLSGPEAIPGVIAFWSEILRELQVRTGGNAFDNRDTIYSGSSDDIRLNREIPRFAADPDAVQYLRQWVTLTGDISDPVYALHTLVDDLIPPEYANQYDRKTVQEGTHDLYVQSYVDHKGHCNFTQAEMTEALKELDGWIRTGKRPIPGDLTAE